MPAAAAVGIAGIVLILVLERWLPKVPAVLVMVAASIASTSLFDLAAHGVSLIGVLPRMLKLVPQMSPPEEWVVQRVDVRAAIRAMSSAC